jgi:hypothetical protein
MHGFNLMSMGHNALEMSKGLRFFFSKILMRAFFVETGDACLYMC